MVEILRMQLRQILGGSKKWLVVLVVILPIVLTWVNVELGGLGKLRHDLLDSPAAAESAPRPPSPNARRVATDGPPVELFDGRIVIRRDQLLFDGRPLGRGTRVTINGGHIVIDDGVVWVDETRRGSSTRSNIRIDRHGARFSERLREIPRAWEMVSAIYLFLLYPQLICLLLALLYGASVPGAELDGKTLTYLFTRPIARWRIVVGKYLAICAALLPPTGLSVAISWSLLDQPGGSALLGSLLLGAGGAVLCYTAIFMLLGFVAPRRAMVLALLYGVVFEFLLSFVPAMINTFTVTYYLRSLVVNALGIETPVEIARIVGGASTALALLVLAATIAVALGLASMLAARREYVIAEEP